MFDAIDRAFAGCPRPERFTDHPYCEECEEAHEFFAAHTVASLGEVVFDSSEAVPVAFLTDAAFCYFFPALARMMARDDLVILLQMTESRLHLLDREQLAATRDFLYALYAAEPAAVHGQWVGYETLERVASALETELVGRPETEPAQPPA